MISIHPPLAGRDQRAADAHDRRRFQSTRPLRGGTRIRRIRVECLVISIHPPLAGRDHKEEMTAWQRRISIHPPLAGRDTYESTCSYIFRIFQSTRPLRGGTCRVGMNLLRPSFQSTRPLRGGTAILHKKTVQNIAYCTKSAFTLAVLSGFLALMRPFFLPNVHKFRCEPSEESLLAPRSHAYTIRTPSG